MISYRQADIKDRLHTNPHKGFFGNLRIVQNSDVHDHNYWSIRPPSMTGPEPVIKKLMNVLHACGFQDHDMLGFSFLVEPGTYADALYNTVLDAMKENGFKPTKSALYAKEMNIQYEVQ